MERFIRLEEVRFIDMAYLQKYKSGNGYDRYIQHHVIDGNFSGDLIVALDGILHMRKIPAHRLKDGFVRENGTVFLKSDDVKEKYAYAKTDTTAEDVFDNTSVGEIALTGGEVAYVTLGAYTRLLSRMIMNQELFD